MDLKKIRELLKLVAESGVSEIEIEEAEFKLTIRKDSPTVFMQSPQYFPQYPPAQYPNVAPPPQMAPSHIPAAAPGVPAAQAAPAAEPAPAKTEGTVIKAPIVGTFYRADNPDSEPFVKVGDTVAKGTTLCIIEAMKLMNEIESEVAGKIVQILVENQQPVEYDQPLFVVEEN